MAHLPPIHTIASSDQDCIPEPEYPDERDIQAATYYVFDRLRYLSPPGIDLAERFQPPPVYTAAVQMDDFLANRALPTHLHNPENAASLMSPPHWNTLRDPATVSLCTDQALLEAADIIWSKGYTDPAHTSDPLMRTSRLTAPSTPLHIYRIQFGTPDDAALVDQEEQQRSKDNLQRMCAVRHQHRVEKSVDRNDALEDTTAAEWKRHLEEDPFTKAVIRYVTLRELPTNTTIRQQLQACGDYFFIDKDGRLKRTMPTIGGRKSIAASALLVVPQGMTQRIMQYVHNVEAAHQSFEKTFTILAQRFFWPRMSPQLQEFQSRCEQCIRFNRLKAKRAVPLQSIAIDGPLQRIHMDIVSMGVRTADNNYYLLVMVDSFTKWAEAVPMPNKEALTTAKGFYRTWVTRHGPPTILITDQGAEFTAALMTTLAMLMNIDHIFTSAYSPQSNGQCERTNQTLVHLIRKLLTDHSDWDVKLYRALHTYRATKHDSTGYSPYELLYGRPMRLGIDTSMQFPGPPGPVSVPAHFTELQRNLMQFGMRAAEITSLAKMKQQRTYNRKVQNPRMYQPGDYVYVDLQKIGTKEMESLSYKLLPRVDGPYEVVRANAYTAILRWPTDHNKFLGPIRTHHLTPAPTPRPDETPPPHRPTQPVTIDVGDLPQYVRDLRLPTDPARPHPDDLLAPECHDEHLIQQSHEHLTEPNDIPPSATHQDLSALHSQNPSPVRQQRAITPADSNSPAVPSALHLRIPSPACPERDPSETPPSVRQQRSATPKQTTDPSAQLIPSTPVKTASTQDLLNNQADQHKTKKVLTWDNPVAKETANRLYLPASPSGKDRHEAITPASPIRGLSTSVPAKPPSRLPPWTLNTNTLRPTIDPVVKQHKAARNANPLMPLPPGVIHARRVSPALSTLPSKYKIVVNRESMKRSRDALAAPPIDGPPPMRIPPTLVLSSDRADFENMLKGRLEAKKLSLLGALAPRTPPRGDTPTASTSPAPPQHSKTTQSHAMPITSTSKYGANHSPRAPTCTIKGPAPDFATKVVIQPLASASSEQCDVFESPRV